MAQCKPFQEKDDLVFFGAGRTQPLNRRTFGDVLGRELSGDQRRDKSKLPRIPHDDRCLTTHSFRHTYNTLMRRTVPAETLRALIGHRDERMTDHYDHPGTNDLIRSLDPARKAIESAFRW